MTKRIAIGIAWVAVAAVILLVIGNARGPAGDRGGEPNATASARPEPRPGSHRPGSTPAAAGGLESERVSEDELQVLAMYEDMTRAFAEAGGSCDEMAVAVEAAVDEHAGSLARALRARKAMTREQVGDAQRRLNQEHGERMAELRLHVKQAVARCKRNPRLMNALRSLARLQAPS